MALIVLDRQTIRKKCVEISPAVYKISKLRQVKREVRLSHLHNILMKVAHLKTTSNPKLYANPNNFYTIPAALVGTHMKHIMDFDKSESIIPHGEVSKK